MKVTNLEKTVVRVAGVQIAPGGFVSIEKNLVDKELKTSKSFRQAVIYNKIKIEDEEAIKIDAPASKKRSGK